MLRSRIFRSKGIAICWLVLITILFFLPGSALPKETWFSKIYIDKWVHTGFFVALLFLWRSAFGSTAKGYNVWLFILALLYGLAVEFVQKWWVPNRDFDYYDLLFDASGAAIGLGIWYWVYKKNKPL
jgi:VanZ family protein